MKGKKILGITITILSIFVVALVCYAAYTHNGDSDSINFRTVYPDKVGSKLDSCNLCHTGGKPTGSKVYIGSCQYCHTVSNYGKKEDFNYTETLNPYGKDYLAYGRNASAITAIENLDSDADGYSNKAEILAGRYPGDSKDDPSKVAAPSKVYTRDELEKMLRPTKPKGHRCDHEKKMLPHSQFLLMNASKSTDFYAQYWGVSMESLLKPLVLPSATGIAVISPDGFAQTHPFEPFAGLYQVNGTYPAGTFFYSDIADIAINTTGGWCDYSAPSAQGRQIGDAIVNPDGLKMMLAIKRDGNYLDPGVFNNQTLKLDGEGPFRVVPPQLVPGYPDQRSNASNPGLIWPYDTNNDHNAGFSTRATTIIRVDPLPTGTTDIDLLDASWDYIDQNKIVIYGAINPSENIKEKLEQLEQTIDSIPKINFKKPVQKMLLRGEVELVERFVEFQHYDWAYRILQDGVLTRMNGCTTSGNPDGDDWFKDCNTENKVYWAVNEIMILLGILL